MPPWLVKLRTPAALAATVAALYAFSSAQAAVLIALDLQSQEHSVAHIASDAIVSLAAFAVGGFIAARPILVPALVLSILLSVWSINYWLGGVEPRS